jgi:hypothetical protein
MGTPWTGYRGRLGSRSVTRVRRALGLLALSALIAALFSAAPAQALSPPGVFLKEVDESDMPIGDWIPLAGAQMHSVNGYEVGVKLPDSGQPQRILVQMTSVPDGHPDQANIFSLCLPQSGTAGQIADTTERVSFEGGGTYSLAVTVSTGTDESTNCTAGPSTSGSFTASAPTRVAFLGHLLIADPSDRHRFGGIQIFPPVGAGGTDVLCARDPRTRPDGSLTGSLVTNQRATGAQESPSRIDASGLFRQIGRWACVARGVGGGVIPGPWSPPTATEVVQTGFYPFIGNLRLTNVRGPRYGLTDRVIPSQAAGGIFHVVFRRVGGRSKPIRLRTRIGRGGKLSLGFRLPPISATGPPVSFLGSISFDGTLFAAARPSFKAFVIQATPTGHGRASVQFTPPCHPRRC